MHGLQNYDSGQHLEHALLVAGVGVQEHVKLLVGPGWHVRINAILGGANAPAGAQERKVVQVLESCTSNDLAPCMR